MSIRACCTLLPAQLPTQRATTTCRSEPSRRCKGARRPLGNACADTGRHAKGAAADPGRALPRAVQTIPDNSAAGRHSARDRQTSPPSSPLSIDRRRLARLPLHRCTPVLNPPLCEKTQKPPRASIFSATWKHLLTLKGRAHPVQLARAVRRRCIATSRHGAPRSIRRELGTFHDRDRRFCARGHNCINDMNRANGRLPVNQVQPTMTVLSQD